MTAAAPRHSPSIVTAAWGEAASFIQHRGPGSPKRLPYHFHWNMFRACVVRKRKIRRLRGLLHQAVLVMQTAEHRRLHHPVASWQGGLVSSLGTLCLSGSLPLEHQHIRLAPSRHVYGYRQGLPVLGSTDLLRIHDLPADLVRQLYRPFVHSLRRRQCATSATGRGGPNVCNCLTDEGRPLGTGWQEQVPNHLRRLWSKALVVSTEGKGLGRTRSGDWQEEDRKGTTDDMSKA